MRLLQQKLGWIRGSNSAESYTGKPLQASHHFTAVQTKQWKIIHNIKNKNHKSLCSYYALEIRAINPFLYDPYLFFNSCPPPFFSPVWEERNTADGHCKGNTGVSYIQASFSVLRLPALQNYVWKKLSAETDSLAMTAFPQSRSTSS